MILHIVLRIRDLRYGYEFEVKVFDECCDLGHYVGREVFGDLPGNGIGVDGLFRSGTEWNRWNGGMPGRGRA